MSCLQHHQLTGTHEGIRTDAAQLLVPSEEPEKGEVSLCLLLRLRPRLTSCDSQSVHLRAIEGVARHLLDAISGEPSVRREEPSYRHEAVRLKSPTA